MNYQAQEAIRTARNISEHDHDLRVEVLIFCTEAICHTLHEMAENIRHSGVVER